MIQNVSNTQSDKQLTAADLARITYASCLNFFHTNSMFNPWPFGIGYSIDFWYVKRLNRNNYQYQESWATTEGGTSMVKAVDNPQTKTLREIENKSTDLVCNNDGEERLILICKGLD